MMKKDYKTPRMKVVEVRHSSMLCSSPMNVYSVGVTEAVNEETGTGIAW